MLRAQANPAVAAWWNNYVKDCAPFLGVRMSAIRTALHSWYIHEELHERPAAIQKDIAFELFRGTSSEEKLSGILALQEILLPNRILRCGRDLGRFKRLFRERLIHDWNVCDWLCVKVLGPFIEQRGMACAAAIASWSTADYLWQARASVVAFVPVADQKDYHTLVFRSCARLIRREERFAKTAVGWILRDIARSHPGRALAFIEANLEFFSRESLRSATKHLARDPATLLLNRLRAGRSQGPRPRSRESRTKLAREG